MILSYLVGQKKNPIDYPMREIAVYTVLAAVLFGCMWWGKQHLSVPLSIAFNTVLILIFAAKAALEMKKMIRRKA